MSIEFCTNDNMDLHEIMNEFPPTQFIFGKELSKIAND